ncbi:family 20 glycosylhydrolase [Histomonas meleagridis]|uniref:family 20 glycosylhydrolase n=1 Tax=Histomonas meleagridis TaxID=135588 RepID=UPI00355A4244|nr:family 20 glycosylhydrolase [Histomonas meleagridis]KAH0800457.1 family 20 glycosylhydrolase [Histomonas meleagridis]
MLGWKSGETTPEWAKKKWDLSSAIKANGTYEITFRYTHGKHRLDMKDVKVTCDGKTQMKDKHEGTTGAHHTNNVYRVTIDKYKAPVILKAKVRSDGGNDSNGNILIRKV